MASLVWDQAGEREFETGVDRGVLYLQDGTAVAWNGLTGVEDSPVMELRSYYLDGRKYLEYLAPGEFSGKLTAYTYPDELDSVTGVVEIASGLSYYDQPAKSFNLSYRTRIGNDLVGVDHGYKIHVLYNILANPDGHSSPTLGETVEPSEFSWTLSGKPPGFPTFLLRPTVHVSIDSTKVDPTPLEARLYGTSSEDPSLPEMEEILSILGI